MTANESLVGGFHVDLRMAAGCGWPRPVVDQAIGWAVQERDLEVAGAGKMFSKQVSSSTAGLLEMEADLAKHDVRTDHSLHGRRATGYPHQTGKLMLPHPDWSRDWQREIMLECQRERVAKAKAEGRYRSSKRRDPASVS